MRGLKKIKKTLKKVFRPANDTALNPNRGDGEYQ